MCAWIYVSRARWRGVDSFITKGSGGTQKSMLSVRYCTNNMLYSKRARAKPPEDVIKRKLVLCWEVHRSLVVSTHKDQRGGALMLHLICAWTNGWPNNRDTCDLRRHLLHYDNNVPQSGEADSLMVTFYVLINVMYIHHNLISRSYLCRLWRHEAFENSMYMIK